MAKQPLRITFFAALWLQLFWIAACSSAADNPTASPAAPASTETILVWQDSGPNPLENTANTPGVIGLIGAEGEITPLLDVPSTARTVKACGDTATSPDSRWFAFYVGHTQGTLYLMDNHAEPVEIGEAAVLSCLSSGGFRYTPDSEQLAYINYGNNPTNGVFVTGTLRLLTTADGTEAYQHDRVAGFDLNNAGVLFGEFFTNDRNQVDQLLLHWWENDETREVATLRSDPQCRFTGVNPRLTDAYSAIIAVVQRCPGVGSSWQLYNLELGDGRISLIGSEQQAGTFAPYSRTNLLLLAPDAQTAFLAAADGVTAHTAAMLRVNIADMAVDAYVDRQMMLPALTRPADALPLTSPDGRWFAAVVTSPNGDNTLTVFDLADNTKSPLTYPAARRGDVVADMVFTPDSEFLYFIAGKVDSARETSTALYQMRLSDGETSLLRRGRYIQGMALAPDASHLSLLEYVIPDDDTQPGYLNLVSVPVDGSTSEILYTGATLTDDRVRDLRFAYPLSWRP